MSWIVKETVQSRQAVSLAHRIKIGNRVIASALDIARDQVFTAGSHRTEEQIADIRNRESINRLRNRGRGSLEERIDVRHVFAANGIEGRVRANHAGRIKEGQSEVKLPVRDDRAVVGSPLNIVIQLAVSEPKEDGGKLGFDAGIYGGIETVVGREGIGAEQGRKIFVIY